MVVSTDPELIAVVEDLLEIAKAVMPTYHYQCDRRVLAGRDAVKRLRSDAAMAASTPPGRGAQAAGLGQVELFDDTTGIDREVMAALDLF